MLTVMSRSGIEPFSPEAVSVFATALAHAHRLGHRHLGTEHLLLAVASADHPTGAILRDHGVTPERVEQEIRAGPFGGLDRDACWASAARHWISATQGQTSSTSRSSSSP